MDSLKHKDLFNLHKILHDNSGVRYFVIALGLIVATGLAVLAVLYQEPKYAALTVKAPVVAAEPIKFYSPLTGNQVADELATQAQVTSVMIENSPDARPQSGLAESGVVFEAIAEGGITRFLVLYQEGKAGLIGPVRSLRPYYVDWLAAFDATAAHIGGSANALREIRNGSYKDIDQFFNPGAYYRASDRFAPHNVYTNSQRLDDLNNAKNFKSSKFSGFTREVIETKPAKIKQAEAAKVERTAALPKATTINVQISSGQYNSSYTYDPASNTYPRSQGSAPHTDREKGQIAPRVVVVMKIPTKLGLEDGYREQMSTIGSGEAYIFQAGTLTQGTWQKESKTAQIKFVDGGGNEILLARGQTWLTAIAPDKSLTWQ